MQLMRSLLVLEIGAVCVISRTAPLSTSQPTPAGRAAKTATHAAASTHEGKMADHFTLARQHDNLQPHTVNDGHFVARFTYAKRRERLQTEEADNRDKRLLDRAEARRWHPLRERHRHEDRKARERRRQVRRADPLRNGRTQAGG